MPHSPASIVLTYRTFVLRCSFVPFLCHSGGAGSPETIPPKSSAFHRVFVRKRFLAQPHLDTFFSCLCNVGAYFSNRGHHFNACSCWRPLAFLVVQDLKTSQQHDKRASLLLPKPAVAREQGSRRPVWEDHWTPRDTQQLFGSFQMLTGSFVLGWLFPWKQHDQEKSQPIAGLGLLGFVLGPDLRLNTGVSDPRRHRSMLGWGSGLTFGGFVQHRLQLENWRESVPAVQIPRWERILRGERFPWIRCSQLGLRHRLRQIRWWRRGSRAAFSQC